MTTCNICCEKINKSNRQLIECSFCDYTACRDCCQTFILGNTSPKCMKCAKEWSRAFIRDNFTNSFINGQLKKHREDVLFDQERALLPATQPFAEARMQLKTVEQELADTIILIRDLKNRKNILFQQKWQLENSVNGGGVVTERRQFIKRCSVDDCRGFLSSQYKCGMCETWCCPDCHVIIGKTKDAPHTCDPNDVESVKLMKVETKACPKCAVPIFKIDGCDQMWCPECKTAFSWKTGAIEHKIHNPHYYEWLRKTKGSVPREPECGEQFNILDIITAFRTVFRSEIRNGHSPHYDEIFMIVQNLTHIQQVEIRPDNYEMKNREIRIKYLLKEIGEEKMKLLLQQAEKKHNKTTDIQNVFQMVVTGATDILHRCHNNILIGIWDENILLEIRQLVEYANETLCEIQSTYGLKVNLITKKLKICSIDDIWYNTAKSLHNSTSLSFKMNIEDVNLKTIVEAIKDPKLKTEFEAAPNYYSKILCLSRYAKSIEKA